MRGFDDWLGGLTEHLRRSEQHDTSGKELPEGIIEQDGEFLAECCCCHEWKPIPVEISEIPDGYEHYCGGSPRCCP